MSRGACFNKNSSAFGWLRASLRNAPSPFPNPSSIALIVFLLFVNAAIKSDGNEPFCSNFAESGAFLDPEISPVQPKARKSVAFNGTVMASFR
ncbi:MAG: hypothetical protein ACXW3Z_00770, partial [Limisphaerales bacterium]